jgi:hypothetical protein
MKCVLESCNTSYMFIMYNVRRQKKNESETWDASLHKGFFSYIRQQLWDETQQMLMRMKELDEMGLAYLPKTQETLKHQYLLNFV